MKKRTLAKLGGFAIAAATTATLVGFAANGTGAYFTDSHAGTINSSSGTVKVSPTSSLTLNYNGLLPDEFQTDNITYTNTGTGAEDIWLVIPGGFTTALNGPGGSNEALGRYGHFEVDSTAGDFVSSNLASDPADIHSETDSNAGTPDSCAANAQGHGGSGTEAVSAAPSSLVPYCPVPSEILLDSGLPSGAGDGASITFGLTKIWSQIGQEGLPSALVANFDIVATQPGILPSDPNNSVGTPQ